MIQIATPGYLSWRKENLLPHKNLHVNVYSTSVHNQPKLETTQMDFSGVSTLTGVHPHHGASKQEAGTKPWYFSTLGNHRHPGREGSQCLKAPDPAQRSI